MTRFDSDKATEDVPVDLPSSHARAAAAGNTRHCRSRVYSQGNGSVSCYPFNNLFLVFRRPYKHTAIKLITICAWLLFKHSRSRVYSQGNGSVSCYQLTERLPTRRTDIPGKWRIAGLNNNHDGHGSMCCMELWAASLVHSHVRILLLPISRAILQLVLTLLSPPHPLPARLRCAAGDDIATCGGADGGRSRKLVRKFLIIVSTRPIITENQK